MNTVTLMNPFLLPLVDRFNQMFKEFMLQGKHVHRNKLVFLLDELLRQDKHTQLNNMLTESLELEERESTEDKAESAMMEDESCEGKWCGVVWCAWCGAWCAWCGAWCAWCDEWCGACGACSAVQCVAENGVRYLQ